MPPGERKDTGEARKRRKALLARMRIASLTVLVFVALAVCLEAYSYVNGIVWRNRTLKAVEPLLAGGRAYFGVSIDDRGAGTLVAFSPELKKAVKIALLSDENIAAASDDKTKIAFIRQRRGVGAGIRGLILPRGMASDLLVLDAPAGKISLVSRGLPGTILSAGFGKSRLWGDSNDRIFMAFVTIPGKIYSSGGSVIRQLVFDCEGRVKPEPIIADWTPFSIRDVAFSGDLAIVAGDNPPFLVSTRHGQEVFKDFDVPGTPEGLFLLPGGDAALVVSGRTKGKFGNEILILRNGGSTLEQGMTVFSQIRRMRIDSLNKLVFFEVLERLDGAGKADAASAKDPGVGYKLYKMPLARLYENKPLGSNDAVPIVSFSKGGGTGYYDVDMRSRQIIFKNGGNYYETGYDGGAVFPLWLPGGNKLNWVQVIYSTKSSEK